MKTLINLLDAAGKTIERVTVTQSKSHLVLTFTDGTFGIVDGSLDYDDIPVVHVHKGSVSYEDLYYMTDPVEAGILSEEEWEEMTKARNREQAERQDANDREEYIRLKAKFEPAVKATPFGVIGL